MRMRDDKRGVALQSAAPCMPFMDSNTALELWRLNYSSRLHMSFTVNRAQNVSVSCIRSTSSIAIKSSKSADNNQLNLIMTFALSAVQ